MTLVEFTPFWFMLVKSQPVSCETQLGINAPVHQTLLGHNNLFNVSVPDSFHLHTPDILFMDGFMW